MATVLGARMLCVTLEGATMKSCNFEDPAGSFIHIMISIIL